MEPASQAASTRKPRRYAHLGIDTLIVVVTYACGEVKDGRTAAGIADHYIRLLQELDILRPGRNYSWYVARACQLKGAERRTFRTRFKALQQEASDLRA